MPTLMSMIQELENRLHSLLVELQELKKAAIHLEEENNRLKSHLLTGTVSPSPGLSNLLLLYDDGFHICNVHFAQRREKECLFCMALLQRGLNSQAGEK